VDGFSYQQSQATNVAPTTSPAKVDTPTLQNSYNII